jgi:GDPmannose 4,6-dehydratase
MKTAMITGTNGMDGSILADKLLDKGYKVVGIDRWSPTGISPNLVDAIKNENFIIETGDVTEREFMHRVITKYMPDYLYNMAAISLVPESFKIPLTIFETNTMAVVNMLEIIRTNSPRTRFYQASTSEQIGDNTTFPQNTDSIMLPNSPYAIAKLASYHMVKAYRKAYDLFAVNGMLWNHEGPRRGPTFVTRKITLHITKQATQGANHIEPLQIGNLDAHRDWGLAEEYCDAMILMMEADKPDDYAVNTGESHTIREFIEESYKHLGVNITWDGSGKEEKGYDDAGTVLVEVNPKYYRPIEVPYLCGDHSKIERILGWKPKTKFKDLVSIMMENDFK